MKQELIPAPIDNKNVMTDFTEVFHNGDCLSISKPIGNLVHVKHVYEWFVVENCLCCVEYVFGLQWFRVYVQNSSTEENRDKANRYIQQCVEQLYHDNVTQELIVEKDDTPGTLASTYNFYFKDK